MSGRIIVVTGTDTGVGKTVATAALAALAAGTVAVVKPVQTGIGPGSPGEPPDTNEVHRLSGCQVHELARLPDPLAPDTAARLAGLPIPTVAEHARAIRALAATHDVVIVEGAGGLLVRIDTHDGTLLDLAEMLAAEVFVVCRAGLGTLNHTELTVEALRTRGIEPAGLVIGSWPTDPGLAERCNRDDLPRIAGLPIRAVLPAGAGLLSRAEFRAGAPSWFDPPVR